MRLQVVDDYNKGRQGTGLSDQPSPSYIDLRRSIKWYQNVALELIFGIAVANTVESLYSEHHLNHRESFRLAE